MEVSPEEQLSVRCGGSDRGPGDKQNKGAQPGGSRMKGAPHSLEDLVEVRDDGGLVVQE